MPVLSTQTNYRHQKLLITLIKQYSSTFKQKLKPVLFRQFEVRLEAGIIEMGLENGVNVPQPYNTYHTTNTTTQGSNSAYRSCTCAQPCRCSVAYNNYYNRGQRQHFTNEQFRPGPHSQERVGGYENSPYENSYHQQHHWVQQQPQQHQHPIINNNDIMQLQAIINGKGSN